MLGSASPFPAWPGVPVPVPWLLPWHHGSWLLSSIAATMATLAMVCKMQPHSAALNVVARELALDIADAAYDPQLATHVPRVANP